MIAIALLIMTVPCTNLGHVAECQDSCRCSTLDGYASSRVVKCSFLDLSGIPEILHAATIVSLDLSNNEISILRNASFSVFSRLLTLILSNNEVEDIEINAFAELGMMMDIDLSYNNLQSFNPEIFSFNTVLDNVSLKGNPIAFLSSSSPILISDSISSLDLSSSSLTTIHPLTFSRLPKLYFLDLSFNLLQTISVSIFEKLPDLTILELNTNRWTCNCDVVEVMQWAESRRGQQPAHKPVKCLEGQQYRPLWTMAGGNRSCSESKTTEPVVARDREFTTDMSVELLIISEGILLPLETSSDAISTISQRDKENEVKNYGDHVTVPESERGGGASLLWNVNTLMVFVILPITLGVAVFVSLIAVNYIVKSRMDHRTQHDNQGKDNHVAAFSSNVLLLKTQLTADITKQHAGYESRGSYGGGGTEYHVYERID